MLEARNIAFGYKKDRLLFEDFSLQVLPGERVELRAPSGFGKTTLCRILAGYEQPLLGEVLIDGLPMPKKGPCPVQLIGQHPEKTLDPRLRMRASVAEAGELPSELAEALGVQHRWLDRYPHELSGGELQRFCIARALMVEPRYLIADEISTMLDAVTQVKIWKVLIRIAQERHIGMVFVSHSPALAQRIATRTQILGTYQVNS